MAKPRVHPKFLKDPNYVERLCNDRLVKEVATGNSLTQETVLDILGSVSRFIHLTIKSGSLEGARIPYLGVFKVKPRAQQYKDYLHSLGPDMKKLFKANKTGYDVINENLEE